MASDQSTVFRIKMFREVCIVFAVLWIPLTTTKHDAGLHTNINLPAGNAGKLDRFP